MKNFIKDLFKKNIVFSIIVTLFVISLLITNTVYTNYSDQLIKDWYIDSTTRDAMSYFQSIKTIEQNLNKASYNLYNKNSDFLSYVSGVDRSDSAARYTDIALKEVAESNFINEIYIYKKKDNTFSASYFKDGFYSDQKQLIRIISEYSPNQKWFFEQTQTVTNGTLYYVAEDFSGFYTIFSVSPQIWNNNFGISSENIENFTVFYNDKYMFDSSVPRTGSFKEISPESFNFGSEKYYKDNSKMYIKTINHSYSIITTHDLGAFSSWKLNATNQLTKVILFIICSYIVIFLVSYIISKRKVFSFNTTLQENENPVVSIMKNIYFNAEVDENSIDTLKSYFDNYAYYQCLVAQIDKIHINKNERLSSSDVLKILYIDIMDTFKNSYHTTATICDNDTIIVFLASKSEISYDQICGYINKLRGEFHKETRYTVSVASKKPFESTDNIYTSLQELSKLKQFRFLCGHDSFVTEELTAMIVDAKYPADLEAELINAVILSEHEHSLECMDKFINEILQTNNPAIAREWIATLSFSILKNTHFLYESSDSDFTHLKKIFESETLYECIVAIQGMLPDIELINKNSSVSNIGHFRRYVIEFLENNYSNPNINIAYISERMNMSPTYWGQKFIKEFSVPFNTYLSDYRINKSLKYLKDTNEKISDIALKCGFSNSSYFTKAFRDRYKITPTKFRNTKYNEESEEE